MRSKYPRQGKLIGKMAQYDLTQQQLADGIGMSVSGINAILSGTVDFKLSIARKIATFLSKISKTNVSLSDVVE